MSSTSLNKVSAQGLLVAIGIVFGDIGTSPLYTLSAVMRGRELSENLVLGTFSCILWTLTLQTTIKYVVITLRADNKGEGGIFSLYTLVRRYTGQWLMYPAVIGGAFLLADGLITPPISVSSAVEGLLIFYPKLDTVPIVIAILIALFVGQQFGTQQLGKLFGPVMLVWFSFIGVIGLWALWSQPTVLKAINPYYALHFLMTYPSGFWLLGGVFLCTTGAEALYSDMGHCGRSNIRVSWAYVKTTLLLSYAGQSAWLMHHLGQRLGETSPFYSIVPPSIVVFSIGLATLATIIASQALISGSFTLVSEAMRLTLWPRQRVAYPSDERGQLYVPFVNWALMIGCCLIVLHFRESKNMEAAFGLAVTLTMLMSTVLMSMYMRVKRFNPILQVVLTAIFLTVETTFLIANLVKFEEGGWISVTLGLLIMAMMLFWHEGESIKQSLIKYESLTSNLPILKSLSNDLTIPKFATHLVYLTTSDSSKRIESEILYSILNRAPKRADIYWFIHVCVEDEPYVMRYSVETLAAEDVYVVTFYLGFRIDPRINLLFRMVVEDMVENNEVTIDSRYKSLSTHRVPGDFRFVLFRRFLSYENDLTVRQQVIMFGYMLLKNIALSPQAAYGLDTSNVTIEAVPLVITRPKSLPLKRIAPKTD
ncbi:MULTISPECIES: KUP/HAK/KT family potassium transporter [unclassified Spirosoma]|uniref:KUP/HAK/KT family potassium transporter n=1 Tax=unclassified Spirosoma TaxID=2621999 RepID=UPI0009694C99|nr:MULTISPECIES: KUP/HAK/KT family potassium transporter [unclassified Spirosoma]MBN8826260.1 KUP/HAK/KT family potassium transporter [Spirosoma sp.]OJW75165.1 MAG: potassium transporter Kup [Spirosoma sp. 48-14]